MKIAIVEGYADVYAGGAEKSMAMFSDFIAEDHQVFLICEKKGDYSFSQERLLDVLQVSLQPIGVQGIISYMHSIFSLRKFIRKHKIELLLTHTIHAFPLIRTIKILTGVKTCVYFKWVYTGKEIGELNMWGLNGIDNFIFINQFVANYWQKFIRTTHNSYLIADGISFDTRKTSAQHRCPNRKNLLFAGRIYEGKGLHILLEALTKLDESYVLQVLGYFDTQSTHPHLAYHKQLISFIQDKKLQHRVIFHNHKKNITEYLSEADLVIVPSLVADAQPLVLLEAIAMRCLVIGSNTGGIPEILSARQDCICEPDPQDLANRIKLLSNLTVTQRNEIANKLYEATFERYELRNTQEQLKQVILSM